MSATVLDAGVMIGFFDDTDVHHADAVAAIVELLTGGSELAISSLTLSEVLVRPARLGRAEFAKAVVAVRELIGGRVVEIDESAAHEIAFARAAHPALRSPDAAVVAAARATRAERILTTDADFDGVPGAIQLGEFVARLA